MNKSTHQALSSSVAVLQSRFDFVLRALNPEIDPPASASSSASATSPDLLNNEEAKEKEEKQEEEGTPSTSNPTMLDSLLDMISSMAAPESPPEPLESEKKKTEE
jgi:hypothetical protein